MSVVVLLPTPSISSDARAGDQVDPVETNDIAGTTLTLTASPSGGSQGTAEEVEC